jgi:hypothetical protein
VPTPSTVWREIGELSVEPLQLLLVVVGVLSAIFSGRDPDLLDHRACKRRRRASPPGTDPW